MNPSFELMNGDRKREQTWSRIKKAATFPNEATHNKGSIVLQSKKSFYYHYIFTIIRFVSFKRGKVTAFPNEATNGVQKFQLHVKKTTKKIKCCYN